MYTVDELDERISREKVRIARLKQQLGESVHELARLQEQRQQRASEPHPAQVADTVSATPSRVGDY